MSGNLLNLYVWNTCENRGKNAKIVSGEYHLSCMAMANGVGIGVFVAQGLGLIMKVSSSCMVMASRVMICVIYI